MTERQKRIAELRKKFRKPVQEEPELFLELDPYTYGKQPAAVVLADVLNQHLRQDPKEGRKYVRRIGTFWESLTRTCSYIERCPEESPRAYLWTLHRDRVFERLANMESFLPYKVYSYLRNCVSTYFKRKQLPSATSGLAPSSSSRLTKWIRF